MNLTFIEALVITLTIELSVGEIFIYLKGYKQYLLAIIGIGNILTLPLVWFIFPKVLEPFLLYIVLSESFAIGIESLLITYCYKEIHLDTAILLSLAMNLTSFLAGTIIQI